MNDISIGFKLGQNTGISDSKLCCCCGEEKGIMRFRIDVYQSKQEYHKYSIIWLCITCFQNVFYKDNFQIEKQFIPNDNVEVRFGFA